MINTCRACGGTIRCKIREEGSTPSSLIFCMICDDCPFSLEIDGAMNRGEAIRIWNENTKEPGENTLSPCHKCGSPYKVFIVNGEYECKECYDKFSKRISRIWAIVLFILSIGIWYLIRG